MTSWLHCDAERPQLLNRSFYPLGNSQNANCYFHNRLRDHNLYRHNFCTDLRSWSNDPEQQRQHFLDVVSGRVKLCNTDIRSNFGQKEAEDDLKGDVLFQAYSEGVPFSDLEERAAKPKEDFGLKPVLLLDKATEANMQEDFSLNTHDEDLCSLTDNIIDKLDTNLGNVEEKFNTFTNTNHDYIKNLVKLLDFEKQRTKLVEEKYNNLKKENQNLQEHNEQLVAEHIKQLENLNMKFENVAAYKKKLCQFEKEKVQLEKYYKANNLQSLDFENQCLEINRLKNQLNELKNKQLKILQNYVDLLNFMEDVQIMLSSKVCR